MACELPTPLLYGAPGTGAGAFDCVTTRPIVEIKGNGQFNTRHQFLCCADYDTQFVAHYKVVQEAIGNTRSTNESGIIAILGGVYCHCTIPKVVVDHDIAIVVINRVDEMFVFLQKHEVSTDLRHNFALSKPS